MSAPLISSQFALFMDEGIQVANERISLATINHPDTLLYALLDIIFRRLNFQNLTSDNTRHIRPAYSYTCAVIFIK